MEIGADAPRTDFVILTDDGTQEFEEDIFRIFRRINILEYKNPRDALNKRVIYKTAGYANLLIGTAARESDVPEDQVTISIFRAAKNPSLFKKMESAGELVKTKVPGIYRVVGITKMPFQIVITSELQGAEYADCRALTDRADEKDIVWVINELEREQNDRIREYYGMFISLIAEKNPKAFAEIRKESDMKYPGLMKVFEEEVNEKVNAAEEAKEKETKALDIKNVVEAFGVTLEKAMDSLKIPPEQRDMYVKLIGNSVL